MVLHVASFLLARVDPLLGVATVMLPAVAARVEALIAEEALERFLTGMDSLMHLKVGLGVEAAAAYLLDSY